MVPELRDLLHDAAESPDGDPVDTDVLLSQARRRVSTRRRATVAGAGIGLAAAALVAATITQIGTTDEREPTSPVAPVDADLANAPLAKPGKDYTVVASYDIASLARRGGRLIESATPGDLLVYRIGPDGSSDASEIGLLNPVNDARTPLPDAIAKTGANRIITSRSMIAGASYGKAGAGFWYYDTDTDDWDTITLADVADAGITGIDPATDAISRIQFGTDDVHQLFLSVGTPGALRDRDRLISVSLSDDLDSVDHGEVSLWAMSRGTLVYQAGGATESSTLTLRDLDSGKESEITVPQGPDTCSLNSLWMRNDLITAWEECRTATGTGYSQFQVFDQAGVRQRAVTGTQFEVLTGSASNMLLRSQSPQGLFLYNTGNGKILRLTKGVAPFTDLGASEGDRWVFAAPINKGKGVRITIADLE